MVNTEIGTIHITDVGPRDGLQNQAQVLTPVQRIQLIKALVHAGLVNIEVGSFVSPRAVPAMAGTDEVIAGLPGGIANNKVKYSVLIPNLKGLELAIAHGAQSIELVVAASETMNKENINRTNAQAMDGCGAISEQASALGIEILSCISTAWECPFEGITSPDDVYELADKMLSMGATRVVVADTIGAADPGAVYSLMDNMVQRFGAENLACHFHDTRGMGAANAYAASSCGIRHFDASVGGLGGCPFAPGASGNVATEDLVLMFEQMGYSTGINLAKLVAAADLISDLVQRPTGGHASRWLKRQIEKQSL